MSQTQFMNQKVIKVAPPHEALLPGGVIRNDQPTGLPLNCYRVPMVRLDPPEPVKRSGKRRKQKNDGPSPSGKRQKLRSLSVAKQRRLDTLMDKNNEGTLNKAERGELAALVRETQELALENAQRLAGQK